MSFAAIGIAVGAAVAGAATSAALKPKAPKPGVFTPIDSLAEQQKAISGNLASLPEISRLATATNVANQAETDRLFPWFARLRDKGVQSADDWISGKVDVRENLSQTAAANLGRGVSGSPFGLTTSLNQADKYVTGMKLTGLSSAERWLAMSKSMTPQFDITSMFIRPPQINPQQERNDALRYENDANRFNFVNDPWNQFQSQTADIFGQALQSYLGAGSTSSALARYERAPTYSSSVDSFNDGRNTFKLNPRTGFYG